MLTDFQNAFTDRLISNFLVKLHVMKYPTAHQMRRYTTLRKFELKNRHPAAVAENSYKLTLVSFCCVDWNCRSGHWRTMKKQGWTLQEWTVAEEIARGGQWRSGFYRVELSRQHRSFSFIVILKMLFIDQNTTGRSQYSSEHINTSTASTATTSTAPYPAAAAADEPANCCEVCLVAPRDGFALIPCGHTCFCDICAKTVAMLDLAFFYNTALLIISSVVTV